MSKIELIGEIRRKTAIFNKAYAAREALLDACGRKVTGIQYTQLVKLNRALHEIKNDLVELNEQLVMT